MKDGPSLKVTGSVDSTQILSVVIYTDRERFIVVVRDVDKR